MNIADGFVSLGRRQAAWIILFLLLPLALMGQAPVGSIEGTVTDPSGAVIPDAKVSVTDLAAGRTLSLTTTSAGIYVARPLLPGKYKVEISAPGFRTFVIAEITVQAGEVANGSAQLALGAATEMVEVTAPAAQVDTSRSTIDGVITGETIDRLPRDARNFLELAALEPGVLIRDGGSIDPTKEKTYRTVGVVGRSGTGTRVQIDGIDVTDETVGTTVANISDDAVQEFQLSRSSLDLSTSLTSSGAVSIITRRGGNDYHGSGFWFFRNEAMGARLQFLPTKEPFERKQVGFRAGGPFVKDKLFWFANWERTYQTERAIYISDANFPAVPFGSSNNCLAGCSAGVPLGIRMVHGRLDWNLSSNLQFFYRFGHDWNRSTGGTVPVSPFQNKNLTNMHVLALDATSARLSHSYRFGYVNFNNQIVSQAFSGFGFPLTPQNTAYFISAGAYTHGPNSLAPQETYQDNFQNKYDGTYVFGKHTLRYGVEVNRIILGGYANFAGPLSLSGDFSAATQADVIARGDNPQDPLQYPLLDFSTGPNNGFFTIAPCHGFSHGCHKNTRFAWYAGDTWRALKNLTLNFGTRWEWDSGYFNDESQFTRPAYLDFWAPGISTSPKFPKDRFGPQFGFAWDPWASGKTSIRGGAYVAYEMNIYNNLIFDQSALIPPGIGPDIFGMAFMGRPDGSPITPAVAGVTALPASCQTAAATAQLAGGDWTCLSDPANTIGSILGIVGAVDAAMKSAYATFVFDPTSGASQFEIALGNTFGGLIGGSNFKVPYSIQMNIGFQREIKPGHVLTADYLFNHGVGMPFLLEDLECRRCASTLNAAAAQARVNAVLAAGGFTTVDQWIAANPGGTIAAFGLANDTVYPGRTPDPSSAFAIIQTTNFRRNRVMMGGGFSKYRGVHIKMVGRLREKLGFIRNMTYTASWAIGRSEATVGSIRSEFINNALNKLNPRDKNYFGPTPLDRLHIVKGGIVLDTPGGFRFGQIWTFQTSPPINVFIPGLVISGANQIFTTDISGDGGLGAGAPLADVLSGLTIGGFGTSVRSLAGLNQVITNFNNQVAGRLTPAGQALVDAGIFTQAQLAALRAVVPTIPLIPTGNPSPFTNLFNLDLSIGRPTKLGGERIEIEPWLQVFNLFNHTGLGTYGGLGARFGNLNFDYSDPADRADLTATRGRNQGTRLLQIGMRVSF